MKLFSTIDEQKAVPVQSSDTRLRISLFKNKSHTVETVFQKLLLKAQFNVGIAYGEEDSFFDSVAQAMKAVDIKIPGDEKQENYKRLQVWVNERMQQLTIDRQAYIKSRLICEKYGIKIHIIESVDFGENQVALNHHLIDSEKSRLIGTDYIIDYSDSKIIHICLYRDHFVPLLPRQVSTTPVSASAHLTSTSMSDSKSIVMHAQPQSNQHETISAATKILGHPILDLIISYWEEKSISEIKASNLTENNLKSREAGFNLGLPVNFYIPSVNLEKLMAYYSTEVDKEVLKQPLTALTAAIGNVVHVYGNFSEDVHRLLTQVINPLFEPGEYEQEVYQKMSVGSIREKNLAIKKLADSLLFIRMLFEKEKSFLEEHFSVEINKMRKSTREQNIIELSVLLKKIIHDHVSIVIGMISESTEMKLHSAAEALKDNKSSSSKNKSNGVYNILEKFVIPVAMGGYTENFTICIGESAKDEWDPLYFQARWLKLNGGGIIPSKIVNSVERLLSLARKNNVNFAELCVYALNEFGVPQKEMRLFAKPLAPKQLEADGKFSSFDFLNKDNPKIFLPALYAKAKAYYEKDKDKAYAAYRLGVFYQYGYGVPQDEKMALDLFESAAIQGDPRALYHMALIYFLKESNVLQNQYLEKACDYLMKAAALGEGRADYMLAVIFDAHPKLYDIIFAKLAAYKIQADQGSLAAMNIVTWFDSFTESYSESAKILFEKALVHGDVVAHYQMGFMYERGRGRAPDTQQVAYHYEKAAMGGHLYAAERLGNLYETGSLNCSSYNLEKTNIDKDKKKAVYFYELAAAQGSAKAEAALAKIYLTENNEEKALEYFAHHLVGVDDNIDGAVLDFDVCKYFAAWYEGDQKYDVARELYVFIIAENIKLYAKPNCYPILACFAAFYKDGWGTLQKNLEKALQLCDYVIKAIDKPTMGGYAYELKGQILYEKALHHPTEHKRAKQHIARAIKIYLQRIGADNENIDSAVYYQLGRSIKAGRLTDKELIKLTLNPDADYYFNKAAKTNPKYFYTILYARLASQQISAQAVTDEKAASLLVLPKAEAVVSIAVPNVNPVRADHKSTDSISTVDHKKEILIDFPLLYKVVEDIKQENIIIRAKALLKEIEKSAGNILHHEAHNNKIPYAAAIRSEIESIENNCQQLESLDAPDQIKIILKASIASQIRKVVEPKRRNIEERLLEPNEAKHIEIVKKTQALYCQQSLIINNPAIDIALLNVLASIKKLSPNNVSNRSCFIAYTWPIAELMPQESWIQPFLCILYRHLSAVGLKPIIDIIDNRVGGDINTFLKQAETSEFTILICTESLLRKQRDPKWSTAKILLAHLRKKHDYDSVGKQVRVFPVLLSGTLFNACPEEYHSKTVMDWRDKSYTENLNLLLGAMFYPEQVAVEYNQLWKEFYKAYPALQQVITSEFAEQELKKSYHVQQQRELSNADFYHKLYQQQTSAKPIAISSFVPDFKEYKMLSSTSSGAGDLLREVLCGYYKEKNTLERLFAQRETITIANSYINLAIVEEHEQQDKEKKLTHILQDLRIDLSGIKMDETVKKLLFFDRLYDYENIYGTKKSIKIEDIFEKCTESRKRILVLGRAGIGKSVFCRYAVHQWVAGKLWPNQFAMVIWLRLRNLTESRYPKRKKPYTLADIILKEFFTPFSPEIEQKDINNYLRTNKILWLMDGFDEIIGKIPAHLKELIEQLLEHAPYQILTSRPNYAMRFQYSAKLEIIGFTDENIKAYVERFFDYSTSSVVVTNSVSSSVDSKHSSSQKLISSQELIAFLQNNPRVWGVAHIPINLEIICSVWSSKRLQANTITELYQEVLKWLLYRYQKNIIETPSAQTNKNKVKKEAKDQQALIQELNLLDEIQLEKRCERELIALENIAFLGMSQSRLLLDYNLLKMATDTGDQEANELLLAKIIFDVGLLKLTEATDGLESPQSPRWQDHEYYFLHLTLQEFLAARKLVRLLCSNEKKNIDTAIDFIRYRKYERSLTMVFGFTAGLLNINKTAARAKAEKHFWQTLHDEPRDWAGIYHLQLSIHCLSETHGNIELTEQKQVSQQIQHWLEVSCRKKSNSNKETVDALCKTLSTAQSVIARTPSTLKVLLDNLDAKESDVKKNAAEILGQLGVAAATPAVLNTLFSRQTALQNQGVKSDANEKYIISSCIENLLNSVIATPDILKLLLDILQNKSSLSRSAVINAFSRLSITATKNSQVLPALTQLALDGDNERISEEAAKALGQMDIAVVHTPKVLQMLTNAISESARWYQRNMHNILLHMGKTAALREILLALVKAVNNREWYAVYTLYNMGTIAVIPEVLHVLAKALEDKNAWVRKRAAEALSEMVCQEMVTDLIQQALIKATGDGDLWARQHAFIALSKVAKLITTPEILLALIKGLQDTDDYIKQRVIDLLNKIILEKSNLEKLARISNVNEHLAKILINNDIRVQFIAAKTLLQLEKAAPAPEILAVIAKALGNKDEIVWTEAAWIVEQLDASAVAYMLDILFGDFNDEHAWLQEEDRNNALRALGRLGTKAATSKVLKSLINVLSDNDEEELVNHVIDALSKICCAMSIEELQLVFKIVDDENAWQKKNIITMLGKIGSAITASNVRQILFIKLDQKKILNEQFKHTYSWARSQYLIISSDIKDLIKQTKPAAVDGKMSPDLFKALVAEVKSVKGVASKSDAKKVLMNVSLIDFFGQYLCSAIDCTVELAYCVVMQGAAVSIHEQQLIVYEPRGKYEMKISGPMEQPMSRFLQTLANQTKQYGLPIAPEMAALLAVEEKSSSPISVKKPIVVAKPGSAPLLKWYVPLITQNSYLPLLLSATKNLLPKEILIGCLAYLINNNQPDIKSDTLVVLLQSKNENAQPAAMKTLLDMLQDKTSGMQQAVLAALGQLKAPSEMLVKALKGILQSNDISIIKAISELLNNWKHYGEALLYYEVLITLNAKDASYHNSKGNALFSLKRNDAALVSYQAAIDRDPDAAYHSNKGNTLTNLKRYDEALSCYEIALKHQPNKALRHNNKGDALFNLKRFEEALECYEAAIKLDSYVAIYSSNKSKTLLAISKKQAENAQRLVTVALPEVIALLQKQDIATARSYFMALDVNFDDLSNHEILAAHYRKELNPLGVIVHSEVALKLMQDAKRDQKELGSAHHNLGCYYHSYACVEQKEGRAQEAKTAITKADQHFKQGLELAPHAGLYAEYANFLLRQKRVGQAIAQLQKIFTAEEKSEKSLGYGLMEFGTLDAYLQAELNHLRNISIKATTFAYYLLITAYVQQNDLTAAKTKLAKFQQVANKENNALTFSLLGCVQMLLQDYTNAKISYQQALKLRPNYTVVQQQLKQYEALQQPLPIAQTAIASTQTHSSMSFFPAATAASPALISQNASASSVSPAAVESEYDKELRQAMELSLTRK